MTTRGGNHEGRGTILSQSLMVVEYWYVVIQLLGVIGFAINRGGRQQQQQNSQFDELWRAFREASFIIDWTRILAHAIFMNQLDEMYLTSSSTNSTSSRSSNTSHNNSTESMPSSSRGIEDDASATVQVEEIDTQMVPLVRRKHGGV